MGFCYCWSPSVWQRASGVENCLESCMKYNNASAICWSTFLGNVYFEREGGGKLLSLAGKKYKLAFVTQIQEHQLLVAIVFKSTLQMSLSWMCSEVAKLHERAPSLKQGMQLFFPCKGRLVWFWSWHSLLQYHPGSKELCRFLLNSRKTWKTCWSGQQWDEYRHDFCFQPEACLQGSTALRAQS